MKKLFFILSFSFFTFFAFAQTDTGDTIKTADTTLSPFPKKVNKVKRTDATDTLARGTTTDALSSDSLTKVDSMSRASADTAKSAANGVAIKRPIDSIYLKLLANPFTKTRVKPIYLVLDERERTSKDEVFYLLAGVLLFLAFIKLVFSRYFKNIFRLFFQPSFRQKQTREQLLQSNLPSLLLNLFFIFSAGAYLAFLLQHYQRTYLGFWWLLLYSNASLLILYLFKFIFLSFAGWVFDVKEATETYLFSVYLINKILGVILIPFTLLVAFSEPTVINISITISSLIIFLLFIYRYVVSYTSVRRELKVNVLHFFFYICTFEILPLLLIYKTLITFLNNSS